MDAFPRRAHGPVFYRVGVRRILDASAFGPFAVAVRDCGSGQVCIRVPDCCPSHPAWGKCVAKCPSGG